MPLPPRQYYTIDALSKHLGCSKNDIEYYLATYDSDNRRMLDAEYKESLSPRMYLDPLEEEKIRRLVIHAYPLGQFPCGEVVIMAKEVERFKQKYCKETSNNQDNDVVSEYITIEEAIQLGISRESIFELLPIYVNLPEEVYFTDIEKMRQKKDEGFVFLKGLFKIDNYADIHWDKHNRADLASVCLIRENKRYLLAAEDVNTYKPIFIDAGCLRLLKKDLKIIKPSLEFTATEHDLQTSTEQTKTKNADSFRPKEFITTSLSLGKKPTEIAVDLVDNHGTRKEKFYGLIGRMLSGYDDKISVCNATWRQRGSRFYKKAKALIHENVTTPHSAVTP